MIAVELANVLSAFQLDPRDYTCTKWLDLDDKELNLVSSILMLGTWSGEVIALDISSGQVKWTSVFHSRAVNVISSSTNAYWVYSGGGDGSICKISVNAGVLSCSVKAFDEDGVSSLSVSKDGKTVAAVSTYSMYKTFHGHSLEVIHTHNMCASSIDKDAYMNPSNVCMKKMHSAKVGSLVKFLQRKYTCSTDLVLHALRLHREDFGAIHEFLIGAEETNLPEETNLAPPELDIDKEWDHILEVGTSLKHTKKDVERAIVLADGDIEFAEEYLRRRAPGCDTVMFDCDRCYKSFTSCSFLEKHMELKHKSESE